MLLAHHTKRNTNQQHEDACLIPPMSYSIPWMRTWFYKKVSDQKKPSNHRAAKDKHSHYGMQSETKTCSILAR